MSVINKMLRDLDQRNSEPAAERRHTVSVAATAHAARSRGKPAALRITMFALVLLVTAGAAWWGWQQMRAADVAVTLPPPAVTPVVPASAPVVVAAPVAPTPAQVDVPEPMPVAAAPASAAAVTATPPVVSAAPFNTSLKIETTLKLPRTTKEPAAEPAVQAAQPTPATLSQRLLQAGREAQAQAQTLWNTGAKEAAMDLLQQAVGNVEQGLAVEPVPGQLQLLSTLARDLTRMQLADGRAGAAWDLLVRLEPWIRNDADLWAVRGNAAQRLGRHQDSAHAYLAALQSRPNEQRWLLGAAVSLAASGQTAAAAEMAEKARAVGGISQEVQAYLRQAGVPLKDK